MQGNYSLLIDFCNSLTTFRVSVKESDSEPGVRYVYFPDGENTSLAQKQLDKIRKVANYFSQLYSGKEESECQTFANLIIEEKQRLQAALRYYEPSITEKFEAIFAHPAFQSKPDHEYIISSFRSLDDIGKETFLDAYVLTENELLQEEEHEVRIKELQKIKVDEELKKDLKHRKASVNYLLYGGQQESLLRAMDYSDLSERLSFALTFQEDNLNDIYSVNVLAFGALDNLFDSVKLRLRICFEVLKTLFHSDVHLVPSVKKKAAAKHQFDTLSDLFINKEREACALKALEAGGLINKGKKWTGPGHGGKAAITEWVKLLNEKGYIKYASQEHMRDLLISAFEGLQFNRSEFSKNYAAGGDYRIVFEKYIK